MASFLPHTTLNAALSWTDALAGLVAPSLRFLIPFRADTAYEKTKRKYRAEDAVLEAALSTQGHEAASTASPTEQPSKLCRSGDMETSTRVGF
jgi:hypothetical protein